MLKEKGDTAAQSGKTAISVEGIIADIERRVHDKILEPSNAELLKKLIGQADNINEAISIAELGTTYNRTGFYFDKRLEPATNAINYFKENKDLSFTTDPNLKTHKLIIGDNYPALLNLLIEYRGKIDVIYIDPPYGADSMGQFAKTNYENAITRDNLLSMLYPRLVLARQLLSESGVIFCSIDDRNQAYVKGLFDEVFEEKNFIASLIWERAFAPINLMKHFSLSHDYLICFAKDIEFATCNGVTRSDRTDSRYNNPDNDSRGVWSSSDISVGPAVESNIYKIKAPSGRIIEPPAGRSWRLSEKAFSERLADNRIWFGADGDGVPRIKRFLSELKKDGITPMTIWKHTEVGHSQDATKKLKDIFNGEMLFEYPKPVEFIKRAISLYSNDTSTILDFFAGSGTTGQAVLELNKQDGGNRQFILCTNNEVTDTTPNGIALDVTTKRLKRVMTGQCYDGTNNFKWLEKNKPLGDNLQVLDIAQVADFEDVSGKTPFDVIDETLYGQQKFKTLKEKIEWVIDNFELTQKQIGATTGWLKEQGVK